ncbi:unnamed protein product [Phaeothamnion confervicola]
MEGSSSPSGLSPTSLSRRRSCQRCVRLKKKCDGGSFSSSAPRCSRCEEAGESCVYGVERPRGVSEP